MARTGMQIDERGTQGVFGDFSRITATGSRDVWIGRLSMANNELVNDHGLKLNNHVRAISNAKMSGQPAAVLPLPERQKAAVMREKRLNEIENQRNQIASEMFDLEISLTPFDYSKEKISEAMLARLTDKFAGMNEDARKEALKTREFRMAVLKEPHQMSSMMKSDWDMLRQQEIARRFPDESARLALAKSAVEEFDLTQKTIRRAHDVDKKSCNADAEPVVLAEDKKAWA